MSDLISDKKFLTKKPQIKINFLEYIAEVEKVVNGITIKDWIGQQGNIRTRLK